MKRQWIAVCAAALCSGSAWAFDFGAPSVHPTGSWPEVVVVGDVNGDQLDDVVLGTTYYFDPANDGHLFVYLQRPDGSLSMPLLYPYTPDSTINNGSMDVALGDFNRDGAVDVATCSNLGLSVLTYAGAGFALASVSGASCGSVALMDIDLDGNLDIIAWTGRAATLYYGDGRGAFPRTGSLPLTGGSLLAGDLTGDGLPDLVVTGTTILVYPHDPKGGFLLNQSYPSPTEGWSQGGAAIGDFNHDGRLDLAVNEAANSPNSAVWIYSQNASGTLDPPQRFPSYDIPTAMVALDLDHNGWTDLLVGHNGWAAIGRYMQDGLGLASESLTSVAYEQWNRHALAAGDINGDGCTDAVFADYNAGLETMLGTNCVPGHARADVNGDGVSDVVWRNASTGGNAIWLSADPNPRFAMPSVSLVWRIAAIGDFDGDGKADLLWHEDSNGASVIWYHGDAATATVLPRVTDTGWNIVGAGDVDGDGKDDVVWRHATTGHDTVWLSANSSKALAVAPVTDAHWKIVAVDDFDGDGKADLLWRNDTTGADAVWPAADTTRRRNLLGVTDLNWIVGGTGDFDGDGKADIFWRQTSTGANTIWRSGDATNPMRVATGGRGWQVVVGDYTGDRKADLLWRDSASGVNVIWRAAQASVQRDVTDVTVSAWRLMR